MGAAERFKDSCKRRAENDNSHYIPVKSYLNTHKLYQIQVTMLRKVRAIPPKRHIYRPKVSSIILAMLHIGRVSVWVYHT